jgi:competence protein ComEA
MIVIFCIGFYCGKLEQISIHRAMVEQSDQWEESEVHIVQRFYITGEVQNPGLFEFQDEICLMDAIEMAGGITDQADLQSINPARIVRNGEKIQIPSRVYDSTNSSSQQKEIRSQTSSSSKKLNINVATKEELMSLPNIGASRAQDILDYRETVGFFVCIEEIMDVPGIGPKTFAAFQDLICIDGSG